MAADQVRILGLDIGTNSVGWALVETQGERPASIVALGCRIFRAGMEGSIEQGKENSRNKKRREARLVRRQLGRRKRRRSRVFGLLAANGLLPEVDAADPKAVSAAIDELDQDLTEKWVTQHDHRRHQLLPYLLRAHALQGSLEPFELGRALYHLAHRRGFLSNRRTSRPDEDVGQIKQSISDLAKAIAASGKQTLGAYLATLDPDERRIRQRWTGREMYVDEFEKIFRVQASHHAILTPRFQRRLRAAMFFQRPLRSQKGLVGRCDLEPRHRRAPLACLQSQRFRLLQKVNDLRWWPAGGGDVELSAEQRARLIDVLSEKGDLRFPAVRTLLGFKRGKGKFNHEEGGARHLIGNRTEAKLRALFEEGWDSFSAHEHERIVHDLLSIQSPAALAQRGRHAWGLAPDRATSFGELQLEDGYAAHSLCAIQLLLPLLENGMSYAEARLDAYPDRDRGGKVYDALPPVTDVLPALRNPAVQRSLTEVRKVVNAVLRQYGKPDRVRIELARDLKQSRKVRVDRWKRARDRERERANAKERIFNELGYDNPRRSDIEKVLLADECRWKCPYTGKSISWAALLGTTPQFDFEHILPFSRTLDNSFANKTLCYSEENRYRKGNRTPFEAYGADPQRYDEILDRVRHFTTGDWARRQKLERFERKSLEGEDLEGFANRQLADTRYTARLAVEYAGLLYGGVVDDKGRRRVQVSAGGATAILRNAWGLNTLLGDGNAKDRKDHRHHAIDATVVAFTGPSQVKQIADAAQRAEARQSHRLYEGLELPWATFRQDLAQNLQTVVPSHRVDRVMRGPLHEETLYGRPHLVPARGGSRSKFAHHVRKPVAGLTEGDLPRIVDPAVRGAVLRRLEEARHTVGKALDPGKAFAEPKEHPYLTSRDGRRNPIHRVRVATSGSRRGIGRGPSRRYVKPGSNFHMAIVAELDADGNDRRWRGDVVTLLEAFERRSSGVPVVQREFPTGREFRFTLRSGDSMVRVDPDGRIEVFHVQTVSRGKVELLAANDARPSIEVRRAGVAGGRITRSPDALRKEGFRKVAVDTLGGVRWSGD